MERPSGGFYQGGAWGLTVPLLLVHSYLGEVYRKAGALECAQV